MATKSDWLLTLDKPETTADKLERLFRREIRSLESAVQRVAKGERAAAREYIVWWRLLTNRVLALIRDQRPDLVTEGPGGQLLLVDIKGDPIEVTSERLLAVGPTAPFSGWVAPLGLGRGIAVRLVAEVRECVPGAVPLVPPAGLCVHWASGNAMRRALQLLGHALAEAAGADDPGTKSAPLLKRVMELFELDRTELARLFGVKRQAVEQWERRGVPADRQAKLATIVAIGELLDQKLRPGLLPGVARRTAPAYRGRTMLQMIAVNRHEELLKSIRESFDWAATA